MLKKTVSIIEHCIGGIFAIYNQPAGKYSDPPTVWRQIWTNYHQQTGTTSFKTVVFWEINKKLRSPEKIAANSQIPLFSEPEYPTFYPLFDAVWINPLNILLQVRNNKFTVRQGYPFSIYRLHWSCVN